MCDERTEQDNDLWLSTQLLRRRDFSALGAAASAAWFLGACAKDSGGAATAGGSADASSGEEGSVGEMVQIATPDGTADAYFVRPASGKHPAVVMWPDIAGLRDAYKTMGTRLAQAGYAVLVVNQYYRSSPAPVLTSFAEWRTDEGRAKLAPMIEAITAAGTDRDGAACIDWLMQQDAVDSARKAGSCGYCMGGPFTFRTAAARPEQVGAICSFHGANLVSDADNSVHLLLNDMQAALLIAIAENDDSRQPEAKTVLRETADAAGRTAEIEVYPAQHGFCTIDSPVYDETQAEKAWARMLATFEAQL